MSDTTKITKVHLTPKNKEMIKLMRDGMKLFVPMSGVPYFWNYRYDKAIDYATDIEPLIENGLIKQPRPSDFLYLTFNGQFINIEL